MAYAALGRPSRAIEDFNRAIDLGPTLPALVYYNRGLASLQTGEPAKALHDLNTAIEKSPAYASAFQARGDAYAKLKDWPHAIADYTAAIELNPGRVLYEKRSAARSQSGDTSGADQDLKRSLDTGASLSRPMLLSPAEGTVFNTYPRSLTLTWEPVPGAASYLMESDYYADNAWNTELNHLPVTGTTATFDFVGAQPGQRGPASEWRTFRFTR